jgi:preprotein translocase subunit SecD
MKFDDAINYIAETTLDLEMAKPKNPEIEKLVAQGMPYYKARNIVNARNGGNTSAAVPAAEPAAMKYKELPDTLRTKDAVATYLQHNPGATPEEVMSAIGSQNSEETPLNLDPEVVKSAIADAQSDVGGEMEPVLDPAELRKNTIRDRIAAKGMKITSADKSAALKNALKNLAAFRHKKPGKVSGEPLKGFEVPDEPEVVGGTGSQNPYDYEGQD